MDSLTEGLFLIACWAMRHLTVLLVAVLAVMTMSVWWYL